MDEYSIEEHRGKCRTLLTLIVIYIAFISAYFAFGIDLFAKGKLDDNGAPFIPLIPLLPIFVMTLGHRGGLLKEIRVRGGKAWTQLRDDAFETEEE